MSARRISAFTLILYIWLPAAVTSPTYARERTIRTPTLELQYTSHFSGRAYRPHYSRETWDELYKAVWIRVPDAKPRRLQADPEYGFFVAYTDPTVSPTGAYVVLDQLVGGMASDGDNEWWHDSFYCVFVETHTARILARETGEICGGEFSNSNTWTSSNGEIDLSVLSK
jgi:hypothetical protein